MMKRILILSSFFLVMHVNAQTLSLHDAITISLKNNFDIQLAKNENEIQKINNNIGVAGGLPLVSATVSDQEAVANLYQKTNTGFEISKNGANTNNLNANLTGSILLYNGYRVVATKKRLEELQSQSQQQLNAQIQATIEQVMLTYYNIVRQQFYSGTLEKSIDLSQQQLKIITSKKSLGLANNADLFQAQIDVNAKSQDLESQHVLVSQLKSDLLNLLNLKPDSTIQIVDSIQVDPTLVLSKIQDNIALNPSIASLVSQIKINELIEKETAALNKPSLKANTGVTLGRTQSTAGQLLTNQSYGPFVGIGLTVPIYNGSIYKRQVQTARIHTQSAQLLKDKALSDANAVAIKAYQTYSNSLLQIKSQEESYQLAKQLVELSLQRYQLAVATILELRESQKSFEDAAYRLVNLKYLAKISEIELRRLNMQLNY